ncbi:hypothetical protein C8R46DRAFT_1301638, partial [Mycena filopes]
THTWPTPSPRPKAPILTVYAQIFRASTAKRVSRHTRLFSNSARRLDTSDYCPYKPGSTIPIYFRPELPSPNPFALKEEEAQSELSQQWTEGFTALNVKIMKTFTPFTCAVAMLAQTVDPPAHLKIPEQFILKLSDRRCGYRDEERPELVWNPSIETELRAKIRELIGPARSTPLPPMYSRSWAPHPEDPDDVGPEWEGWELEVHIWLSKQWMYLREALAYRHLRALQGDCIPRLYGTVRHPISSGPFVHPLVDFVPGLAIEYIPGPSMVVVKGGVDLSREASETTSRRLIDNVAKLRGLYCRHNDLAFRNVVLRNWPHDPDPVIIDFGSASVIKPGEPPEKWAGCVDEVDEIRAIQSMATGTSRRPGRSMCMSAMR